VTPNVGARHASPPTGIRWFRASRGGPVHEGPTAGIARGGPTAKEDNFCLGGSGCFADAEFPEKRNGAGKTLLRDLPRGPVPIPPADDACQRMRGACQVGIFPAGMAVSRWLVFARSKKWNEPFRVSELFPKSPALSGFADIGEGSPFLKNGGMHPSISSRCEATFLAMSIPWRNALIGFGAIVLVGACTADFWLKALASAVIDQVIVPLVRLIIHMLS